MERVFRHLGFVAGSTQPSIACDNQQTVGIIKKAAPLLTTRLRHVDIHQFWLRQEVQARRMAVHWVATAEMPADGLTKLLPRQQHETFIRQLGLVNEQQTT